MYREFVRGKMHAVVPASLYLGLFVSILRSIQVRKVHRLLHYTRPRAKVMKDSAGRTARDRSRILSVFWGVGKSDTVRIMGDGGACIVLSMLMYHPL